MGGQLLATLVDGAGNAQQAVDSSQKAARVSVRPVEHGVRGHYRANAVSGASVSVGAGAAGIIANFMPPVSTSLFFVVTKITVQVAVLTAITTATPYDFAGFTYTGATAVSAGAASTVVAPTRMRQNMAASAIQNLTTAGEIRAIGTGTTLTAATGKTNAAGRFCSGAMEILHNVSATGTAVLITAGNASPVLELYKCDIAAGEHPIVLTAGEGIEIQSITAGPVTGTVNYHFGFVWSELDAY